MMQNGKGTKLLNGKVAKVRALQKEYSINQCLS